MAKQNMEEIRKDKIDAAANEICDAFDRLELTEEEKAIITHSAYEAALLQEGMKQEKRNVFQYLPAVIATAAIIISTISIIASLLK